MDEAGGSNQNPIQSAHKAIAAFFPSTVWEEQSGEHELLGTFMQAACLAARWSGPFKNLLEPLVIMLLKEESPISWKQAAILALPHWPWWNPTNSGELIQLWAAATSVVPHTDNICLSVVDTLLQIASMPSLQQFIPPGMWVWLNKRPLLPPICVGRNRGSTAPVVQIVWESGDVEIITSYLLLIWSPWDGLSIGGLGEMLISLRKGFSGIGMARHRKALLQRLDRILWGLGPDWVIVKQYKPSITRQVAWERRMQYNQLMGEVLEIAKEAVDEHICEPPRLTILFVILTPMNNHRAQQIHVCNSSSLSIVVYLEHFPHPTLYPTPMPSLYFYTDYLFFFPSWTLYSCVLFILGSIHLLFHQSPPDPLHCL